MNVPHVTRHLAGFVQTARLVEKELRHLESTEDFADALNLANQSIGELRELYNRILVYARDNLLVDQSHLPKPRPE